MILYYVNIKYSIFLVRLTIKYRMGDQERKKRRIDDGAAGPSLERRILSQGAEAKLYLDDSLGGKTCGEPSRSPRLLPKFQITRGSSPDAFDL